MKRAIIAGLALACAAMLVTQDLEAGIGIKGGYSLAKFSLTLAQPADYEFDYLPGFIGGIFLQFKLGFISVQPELLYTRMGAKYQIDTDRLEFRFDYIQAPVLMKFNILPVGPVRPFFYGGGYGAYMFRATGVTIDATGRTETDILDSYQRFDYGVVGGVGIGFHLPGITLTVEGRYNHGLRNIDIAPAAGESTKNRSIMALVGIAY